MSGHRRIARIFGYGLSAVCIVVLVVNVDWARFLGYFSSASPIRLAAAVPLVAATYLMFALRWRLLLSFDPKPSVVRVFGYLMLGYLANVMLPMRAGDALRVVLLRRAYGHGTTRAVSSIVLERILDVLTMLAIGAAIAFNADLPETILVVLRTAGFLVAAAIAVIIVGAMRPRIVIRTVDSMIRSVNVRLADAAVAQIEQFIEAIGILVPRDRGSTIRAVSAITLGLGGWLSYGLAMALCTAAFGVQPAVTAGLLLTVLTNLGSAIPSSPASLGVYHALGILALSPWRIGLDLAFAVATATHAITVGVQVTLGLLAMMFLKLPHPFASASVLSNRSG